MDDQSVGGEVANVGSPDGVRQIALVEGDDGGFGGGADAGGSRLVIAEEGTAGVEYENDGVGAFERAGASFDAQGFDEIVRVAQAGGVAEDDGDAVEVEGLLKDVAGGAGDLGDDGAVGAEQRVHERGLADVGTADQGNADAVALHDSAAGGGESVLKTPVQRVQRGGQEGTVHGWDFVFVEVDFGFHLGQEVEAGGAHLADGIGETSSQLIGGDGESGGRWGGDEVGDGLGLGEVEATVEEGAEGELAGAGGARASGQCAVQDAAKGHGAAVATEFSHVLAGVGAGAGHEEQEGLVDQVVVAVVNPHKVGVAGFGVASATGEATGNPEGFRSADSHNADAASTHGGGDGGDGVSGGGAGVHQQIPGARPRALMDFTGGLSGRGEVR